MIVQELLDQLKTYDPSWRVCYTDDDYQIKLVTEMKIGQVYQGYENIVLLVGGEY